MTESFPKSFIDLIRQGDMLTFCQSSLIDVKVFIYTSDFIMHHFTLFSVMAEIEKWRFSNCPRFRLKSRTSKRLKSTFENKSLYRSFEQSIKKFEFSRVAGSSRFLQKLTVDSVFSFLRPPNCFFG